MKNKSWKYPFGRIGDSRFDHNKDGELDHLETFFRDWHIYEMEQRAKEREKNTTHSYSGKNYDKPLFYPEKGQLPALLAVIAILIGALFLAFSIDTNGLLRGLILLGSIYVSLKILKSVDLYE